MLKVFNFKRVIDSFKYIKKAAIILCIAIATKMFQFYRSQSHAQEGARHTAIYDTLPNFLAAIGLILFYELVATLCDSNPNSNFKYIWCIFILTIHEYARLILYHQSVDYKDIIASGLACSFYYVTKINTFANKGK